MKITSNDSRRATQKHNDHKEQKESSGAGFLQRN